MDSQKGSLFERKKTIHPQLVWRMFIIVVNYRGAHFCIFCRQIHESVNKGGVESACLLHNIPNERNFLFLPHKYFVVAKSAETWYLLLNVWIKFCRQLPPSRGHFPFGIVISDPILYQFNPPPDLIKIGHKSNKLDLFQAISKGKSLKTGFIQSDWNRQIDHLCQYFAQFVISISHFGLFWAI